MSKEWKEIKGYEGHYLISSSGDVISLNYRRTNKAKMLVWKVNNKGYAWVELCKNGIKEQKLIHRIVAETFIDNPKGYKIINHKDENPLNNNVDNLEWCNNSYNALYSMNLHPDRTHKGKNMELVIIQLDREGNIVKEWENARTIFLETGMSDYSITEVCRGNRHTAYGYLWRYANKDIC